MPLAYSLEWTSILNSFDDCDIRDDLFRRHGVRMFAEALEYLLKRGKPGDYYDLVVLSAAEAWFFLQEACGSFYSFRLGLSRWRGKPFDTSVIGSRMQLRCSSGSKSEQGACGLAANESVPMIPTIPLYVSTVILA